MFVACSTLCFARQTLEGALERITELEFTKFEAAIHEHGRQLRPSEVVQDVHQAAARLRHGPGLVPAAFSVHLSTQDAREYTRQFQAICRLARIATVPLVSLDPLRQEPNEEVEQALERETQRLSRLIQITDTEGILLSVTTLTGTVTEIPEQAVALCTRVPGLGLTLDPSHYISGPHQGKSFDAVFPHVRNVHLRDSGRGPDQFQVRVGQGEVEYGRLVIQLARHGYERLLTVDVRDIPDAPFPMMPEVRKLKYLLESLV